MLKDTLYIQDNGNMKTVQRNLVDSSSTHLEYSQLESREMKFLNPKPTKRLRSIQKLDIVPIQNNINNLKTPTTERISSSPLLTVKHEKNNPREYSNTRDFEATKYNSTIQNTELGKSFIYYWKIYEIEQIFQGTEIYIEHPIFLLGKFFSLNKSLISFHTFQHTHCILNSIQNIWELNIWLSC